MLLSRPYLTGFAFSHVDAPTEISEPPSENPQYDIYRHRDALGDSAKPFEKYMDLNALGIVLVEVAEWRPLRFCYAKSGRLRSQMSMCPWANLRDWANRLVDEKLESGIMHFRMGDVVGRAVAGC